MYGFKVGDRESSSLTPRAAPGQVDKRKGALFTRNANRSISSSASLIRVEKKI